MARGLADSEDEDRTQEQADCGQAEDGAVAERDLVGHSVRRGDEQAAD